MPKRNSIHSFHSSRFLLLLLLLMKPKLFYTQHLLKLLIESTHPRNTTPPPPHTIRPKTQTLKRKGQHSKWGEARGGKGREEKDEEELCITCPTVWLLMVSSSSWLALVSVLALMVMRGWSLCGCDCGMIKWLYREGLGGLGELVDP